MLGAAAMHAQTANPVVNTALSPTEQKAVDKFKSDVAGYMDMRKHVPSDAKLKPTTDVRELEHRRHELQEHIRKARSGAKQGDIFQPDVAVVFHRLLRKVLDGPDGAKIRTSLAHAEPVPAKKLRVNYGFPNHEGEPVQSAPASLLKDLPLLPQGLEYRLVGSTLVLRDSEANLVVDYLPNVFA